MDGFLENTFSAECLGGDTGSDKLRRSKLGGDGSALTVSEGFLLAGGTIWEVPTGFGIEFVGDIVFSADSIDMLASYHRRSTYFILINSFSLTVSAPFGMGYSLGTNLAMYTAL